MALDAIAEEDPEEGRFSFESEAPIGALGLSTRERLALERRGVRTVRQLRSLSDESLLSIRNIGAVALARIRQLIARPATEWSTTRPAHEGLISEKDAELIRSSGVDLTHIPVSALSLPTRVASRLDKSGIQTLDQLLALDIRDFGQIWFVGPGALGVAQNALMEIAEHASSGTWHPEIRPHASETEPGSVNEEIDQLLKVAGSQRNVQMYARLHGWDGSGRRTLEEVGNEFGLTRERVRQIANRIEEKVKKRQLETPLLDRAIELVALRIPVQADEIERELTQDGLCDPKLPLERVVAAGDLAGRSIPFAVARVGSNRFVLSEGKANLTQEIRREARRLVQQWGVATVDDVVAALPAGAQTSPELVGGLLSSQPDFRWLHEQRGWFWLTSVSHGRNRLLNQIRKVISVASTIRVAELREAVRRNYRMEGVAPPRAVLLELCRQATGYQVEEEIVCAKPPLDWRKVLVGTESLFAEVLEHSGVMARPELEEACLSRGMNRSTFYVYLGNSPILARYARGVYGLVGADIPPGSVEDIKPKSVRNKLLIDYGWTTQGRIWLCYRLSETMIFSGVFHVPSSMRQFVEGEFPLATTDGTSVGTLVIGLTGAWGLGPFFSRRGGEPGDYITLVFNPTSRTATVSIGNADLLDELQGAATDQSSAPERAMVSIVDADLLDETADGADAEVISTPEHAAHIDGDREILPIQSQSDRPELEDGPPPAVAIKPRRRSTTSHKDLPYIVTCSTKHDELLHLPEFADWQAHLSDQGHKKGFVIRVKRIVGHVPVNHELRTGAGVLRAEAREIAADLIPRVAADFRRTHGTH